MKKIFNFFKLSGRGRLLASVILATLCATLAALGGGNPYRCVLAGWLSMCCLAAIDFVVYPSPDNAETARAVVASATLAAVLVCVVLFAWP